MARLIGNPGAHFKKDGHTSVGKWYDVKVTTQGNSVTSAEHLQSVTRCLIYRGGGSWRMKFNVSTLMVLNSSSINVTFAGITFSSRFHLKDPSESSHIKGQAVAVSNRGFGIAVAGEGYVRVNYVIDLLTTTNISGDVELDGKPLFIK
jgi:hypothetical protein